MSVSPCTRCSPRCDTAVSLQAVKPATQTAAWRKRFFSPQRLPCMKQQLPLLLLLSLTKFTVHKEPHLPAGAGVEELTCPSCTTPGPLLWIVIMLWWALPSVCQRHVILEWRTARSCALHPGCWRERMSAVVAAERAESKDGMRSTCD